MFLCSAMNGTAARGIFVRKNVSAFRPQSPSGSRSIAYLAPSWAVAYTAYGPHTHSFFSCSIAPASRLMLRSRVAASMRTPRTNSFPFQST
jgi:hypothetical protein